MRTTEREMSSDPSAGGPEQPPFSGIGFMLSSLGHAVSNRFALILKPHELEPREFALLRRIAVAEGSSQQAVSDTLGVRASNMVAVIDALEDRGLLERRLHSGDRRAHALHMTELGRNRLRRATEAAIELEQTLAQDLSEPQRTELSAMLAVIAERLEIPAGVHGSQIHR
jgi:DNA-binding MarR family transcriptional regulator